MGRRFITAQDIDDLVADGGRELRLDAATRLTDLARERARDHGVTLVEVAPDAGETAPERAPAAAAASTGQQRARTGPSARTREDDPPRRQLRAAIRAGVVAEFGEAPPGLDAAIGRVLDRMGIED